MSRSGLGPIRSIASDVFMAGFNAKVVVGVISYIGLIVIAWMLSRVVPWTPAPGLDKDVDLQRDPLTIALRTALVLSVAWLITSMYTLSWYDLLAWMPLAVLAANKLDKIMLIRGTALSLAYVPGRAIDMGSALDFTATRMRDTVSPIVQMAMVLAVILWWRQPDRPELFPFKKPKATPAAASPTVSGRGATPRKAATSAAHLRRRRALRLRYRSRSWHRGVAPPDLGRDTSAPSCRNLRARRFRSVCMVCNLCRPSGSYADLENACPSGR